MDKKGKIYLVGAGPGDPGLFTLRGKELLEKAQDVVYDFLANPRLLDLAPADVALHNVGKRAGAHSMRQEQINRLLIRLARQGRQVVRLKGGDPFVFGRGGEEALALVAAGIPFEVVPGITSGIAALAYAGIPLTHRGLAPCAVLATGREQDGLGASSLDFAALARVRGTLVFYMGVENAKTISQRLLKHGLAPGTPAAVIGWGTHPQQKVLSTRLDRLALDIETSGIRPPALLVIGKVAALRDKLAWFEKRPLSGRRILVTRSPEQSPALAKALEDLGAEIISAPSILLEPLRPNPPLDASFKKLKAIDWLVFTSVNGVKVYFDRLIQKGLDSRSLGRTRVAAMGAATAKALEAWGIKPDLVPAESNAEGLAAAFLKTGRLKHSRIVLARAQEGRPVLPDALRQAGARVQDLALYRNRPFKGRSRELFKRIAAGEADLVTFTSRSTVDNFMAQFSRQELALVRARLKAASLGPVTSQAIQEAGLQLVIESGQANVEALKDKIVSYFRFLR